MKVASQVVAAALAACYAGQSLAQSCPSDTTRQINIGSLVTNQTMCAARGADRWQEWHASDGRLIDWKRGSDLIDPTKQVGTWQVTADKFGPGALLAHLYGASSWSWLVCKDTSGDAYTLVSTTTGGTITGVRLFSGQVPCP